MRQWARVEVPNPTPPAVDMWLGTCFPMDDIGSYTGPGDRYFSGIQRFCCVNLTRGAVQRWGSDATCGGDTHAKRKVRRGRGTPAAHTKNIKGTTHLGAEGANGRLAPEV